MSNRYTNYDSEAVDLVVCAIPITDGKAENFVKVSPDEEAFNVVKGADGHVARFATHNRVYNVEVHLLGTSEHNQQLAALHAADREDTAGAGVGVFLLKDRNGATILAADKCWIEKLPDWEMGKSPSADITWMFKVVANNLGMVVGGN